MKILYPIVALPNESIFLFDVIRDDSTGNISWEALGFCVYEAWNVLLLTVAFVGQLYQADTIIKNVAT